MAPSVLHQSVSVLFVLLPCLLPLELPLQAPADTRVWSPPSSSSAPLRSSWICCKRAMARSMVDVLTRLKSCILTKCRRKFRHRLRRMMWAPQFSVNSMMAWCIWLSAMKLQRKQINKEMKSTAAAHNQTWTVNCVASRIPVLHYMQVPQLHHLLLSLVDVCELI